MLRAKIIWCTKKAFQEGGDYNWNFESVEEEGLKRMIPKSGKSIWRLFHQSGQKTTRETKAVMAWKEGCCHRSGPLGYLVAEHRCE